MTRPKYDALTLDGYLKQQDMGYRTTFLRTLPATEQLPEMTVGLGLLVSGRSGTSVTQVQRIPDLFHTRAVMLNSFLNEIAERYLELSDEFPDSWQDLVILELGYVDTLNGRGRTSLTTFSDVKGDNFALFSEITNSDKLRLYKKHGLHKIATMVANGNGPDLEHTLETVEEIQSQQDEYIPLATLLKLLNSGIPVDDLALAAQLPPDMLEGIYGE